MSQFTIRDVLVVTVVALLLATGLFLRIGPSIGGTTVAGIVIGKREAIQMPLGDTWRRVFEISYRYQPTDAAHSTDGRHPVDVALYDRLRVGSTVSVRYRRLPVFGIDSALAESSWWSRTPSASESGRELEEFIALCAAGVLGWIAYRRSSRPLGFIAGTLGATVACAVFLIGFLVFPLLFWIWRANPGKGFGWALLCSMVLTTAALHYRIPRPQALPPGSGMLRR